MRARGCLSVVFICAVQSLCTSLYNSTYSKYTYIYISACIYRNRPADMRVHTARVTIVHAHTYVGKTARSAQNFNYISRRLRLRSSFSSIDELEPARDGCIEQR